ncbi:MAG: Ig-like domain-containing protein, partial [Anaerolineaceae bacterium]|nr:Ig-like domain-containing protein [Anaerolineaceae bacterium]
RRSSDLLVPGSGPAFGELTFNVDGSFNYTPLEGFAGEVSFSYRASDGFLESENTLVTITVEPEIKIFLPLILR